MVARVRAVAFHGVEDVFRTVRFLGFLAGRRDIETILTRIPG